MRKDKIWYLKRMELFKDLPYDEMERIERATKMKRVCRKEHIFVPGGEGRFVYFLKSGRVRLYRRLKDGKEWTIDYLEPGDIFGELSLLEGETYDTAAQAVEDSYICMMRKEDFEELIGRHPPLAIKVTKLLGFRVKRIESRIEDLLYRDVHGKLSALLVRLAKEYGVRDSRGILLRIKLSHSDMAKLIGSSRETVTLTLKDFKERGLIEVAHRNIIIKDLKALES